MRIRLTIATGALLLASANLAVAQQNPSTPAPAATEGVTGFSLIPYLPGSKNADMAKWEAAWKKEYGPNSSPDFMGIQGYDGMAAIAHIVAGNGHDRPPGNLLGEDEG